MIGVKQIWRLFRNYLVLISRHIIKTIPVRPILLENEDAYSMFEHSEKFDSVLPIFYYKNQNYLIENIVSEIITPIDNWKNGKSVNADAK